MANEDCLTVLQLRDKLNELIEKGHENLPVITEGCDCYGAAAGLDLCDKEKKVEDNHVVITR